MSTLHILVRMLTTLTKWDDVIQRRPSRSLIRVSCSRLQRLLTTDPTDPIVPLVNLEAINVVTIIFDRRTLPSLVLIAHRLRLPFLL